MSLQHDENNEDIVAESKRENAIVGKKASTEILTKINETLNKLYVLLKKPFK